MALTVEELQIKLGCDATEAQKVLSEVDALVDKYTKQFQSYFDNIGGKGGKTKNPVDGLANDIKEQLDAATKQTKAWKKQYEKTFGETFEESMSKAYKNTGEYMPSGKSYIESESWDNWERQHAKANFRYVGPQIDANSVSLMEKIREEAIGFGRAIQESVGPKLNAAKESLKVFGGKVSSVFQKVKEDAKNTFSGLRSEIAAKMQAGSDDQTTSKFQRILGLISSIRSAASSAGSSIKKAFSHTLLGRFIKRLGSVMMRMAAMKLIRGTIQGVKEGLEMLANAGGTAGQAMDSIKASTNAVKAALGVALMPIVKALAPIFYQLAGAVAAAANMIARFFAILTGQSSYTTAVIADNMGDVSSSVGGAGSAVKGMLADFDELNVLTKNSGGGGGGGANSGYASFVDEQLEGASGGLAERLRNAFLGQEWETLGTELGNAINSIFSEERFAEIGANIGKKVNALFTTTYWTLNSTNFQNIGGSIATFLSNALSNIDFSKLGGIVATKFTALPEIIIGAINKLDFGTVGSSLGDFLKGAIQHFKEFIDRVDWGETAWNLIKGLIDAIVGLDVPGIAADLLSFAGTVIGAVIDGLGTLLLDIADVLTDPNTWKLVKAWLQDLPTVIKNYAIKAANALVQPIVDKLNDLIEKYNNSWFGEHFGKIEPISFELIPEIPEEELTRNYDNAKKFIEAKNATDAIKLKFQAQVEKKIKFKELFENFFNPSSDTAEVEVTPEVKEPVGTSKIFGANSGVTSGGGKTNLTLGVIPTLGDRSKLTDPMNEYVVRKDNPWSAYVNPIYNTGKNFFDLIKKYITGVIWNAPVNSIYNTGKNFFDLLQKYITGVIWKAPVNPIYNTGAHFFDTMKKWITGVIFKAAVNPIYNNGAWFFDPLKKWITGAIFKAAVNPVYNTGKDFFDNVKKYITGVIWKAPVNSVYNTGKDFFDGLSAYITGRIWKAPVDPNYNSDKTFFETLDKKITGKKFSTTVNPELSIPKTYKDAMGDLTETKKVSVEASLSNAKAFKEQLQSALKASASIKTTVSGTTKTIGKVSMSEYAQGGLAYGMTSAIIGEYAGARSNPEVVAPLNKLQGILERSNTGGNKDTMTREQANTMIGLLKELTKKETVVRPSVEFGQVVDRSLKAYART